MYPEKQLNDIIKQVCFVLLLISLCVLIFNQLSYFVSSVLGAFTAYMLLRKPHEKLLRKGWNKTVATLFILTIIVLLVFVLGGGFFGILYNKLRGFHPQLILSNVESLHGFILQKTGYNIYTPEVVNRAVQSLTKMLPNVFSITGSIITNGMMLVFVLYFMLQSSKKMEEKIVSNLPVSGESIRLLKQEIQNMVVSNAVGIPIIMIGQGIVAGIIYWVLGAGDPIVWGLLTGIFGLIPIIGTAGIWLPLAINLFLNGQTWQGIVLLMYGSLIIASVDNLFRMFFLKKYANVHPLVTIFGIILGMNLFGFWGIIFGPLLFSGALVLLKIYRLEFVDSLKNEN